LKTYVFDASALIALLEDSLKVKELVKEAHRQHNQLWMSAVNYGEAYGKIMRDHGPQQAIKVMGSVRLLPIQIQDATSLRAMHAQDLKNRYKLYYADAFAAALAIEHKATLVTSDTDFKKLGHNFPVLWLRTN